jgi:hypothetical protein
MNQGSYITIALRDGTHASIGSDGVRVGERLFALANIQDARQVAPDPETFALRVANERHVVELQPVQPGDGALLLEALFRLRPELRPAGFEPPVNLPAGFPPQVSSSRPTTPNPWSVQSTWPPHPGMYAPPPNIYLPPSSQAQAQPGSRVGRLTPIPRSIGEIIAATIQLFTAQWRRWLLLGLVAIFVPEVIRGGIEAVFQVASGQNLFAGVPVSTGGSASGTLGVGGAGLLTSNDLLLTALDLGVSAVIGVLIGGFSAAILGIAARDALFGHAATIGASIRAGLKRIIPAIGANIISGFFVLVIILPVIVLYSVMLTRYSSYFTNPTSLDASSPSANAFAALACLSLILLVPCGIYAIYVTYRLVLAPYIAATEPLGPLAAVRKSWSLTRGHWWQTIAPIIVVGLLAAIIEFPVSFVQFASYGVSVLVVTPLVTALLTPLTAIVVVVVLYDLRLRKEGYAALASEASTTDEPVPTSI